MNEFDLTGTILPDDYSEGYSDREATFPSAFKNFLKKSNGEPVQININSDGGSVAAQWEIINAMREYKGKITAVITGVAQSSAGEIFLFADDRRYYDTSSLMLHRSWTYSSGNSIEFRKLSEILDKMDMATASRAAELVGISVDEYVKRLEEGRYYVGDEIAEFDAEKVENKKSSPKKVRKPQKRNKITIDDSAKMLIAACGGLDRNITRENNHFRKGVSMEESKEIIKKTGDSQPGGTQERHESPPRKDELRAERERIAEILELAGGMNTPAAQQAISDGMEAGEFAKQQLLRERQSKPTKSPGIAPLSEPVKTEESIEVEKAAFIAAKIGGGNK